MNTNLLPEWFPRMVETLDRATSIPDPASLMVLDTKNGGVLVHDDGGHICGCFYWSEDESGIVSVPNFDPVSSTMLENDDNYKVITSLAPRLEPLLQEYRQRGAQYVLNSHKLALSITHTVVEALDIHLDAKVTYQLLAPLMNTTPHINPAQKVKGPDGHYLIKPRVIWKYFETAYRESVRKAGNYVGRVPETYETTPHARHSGVFYLYYGQVIIASGKEKDMKIMAEVHKDTMVAQDGPGPQLALELCYCYSRLCSARDRIKDEVTQLSTRLSASA